MVEVKDLNIVLKENLNLKDYEDINNLKRLCLEKDKTTLKLELDYKLAKKVTSENIEYINEFMYYSDNNLIGYIGISNFGRDVLEVNGMVHPEFRRRGIFSRLFFLVKDEWSKRKSRTILLLSDNNSTPGLEFIKKIGASYDHSEYEMYFKANSNKSLLLSNMVFRMATKDDSREVAMQNSIYFGEEFNEEDIPLIKEDNRMLTYIAEVDNEIIGKVNLEVNNFVGGIYGLGVRPEYRGKGYGRDILIWGIEKLKEMNTKEVMLQVSVINKNALNLYKSCGFEETSTMDYYKIIAM